MRPTRKQYIDPRAADLLDHAAMRERALATDAPQPVPEIPGFSLEEADASLPPGVAPDAPPALMDPWADQPAPMQVDPNAARATFTDALGSRPVAPQQGAPMALPFVAPDPAPERPQGTFSTGPTIDGQPIPVDPEAMQHRYGGHIPAMVDSPAPDLPNVDPWTMAESAVPPRRDFDMGQLPFVAEDDTENVPIAQTGGNKTKEANPFAISPEDQQRMQEAERGDRRRRIAAGVLRGIGGLTMIGGALTGSPIQALGMGVGAIGNIPANRVEEERARQAREQQRAMAAAGYDRSRRQEDMQVQDAGLRRQDAQQQFALRQQSAESNMAVDRARIGQIQAELNDSNIERLANSANADGLRGLIEANVRALPADNQLAQEWAQRVIGNEAFQHEDAATLGRTAQLLASTVNTHAFQNSGSIGGGGGTRTIRHADGSVEVVSTGGGRRGPVQTIGQLLDSQQAEPPQTSAAASAPAPVAAPRPAHSGRHPAPRPAAAPQPGAPNAPAPAGGDVEIGRQTQLNALHAAYLARYGADFMNNASARAAYDLALSEATGDTAQRRAIIAETRREMVARADEPDAVVPPQHREAYTRAATQMEPVYERYVVPFVNLRATLTRARDRVNGLSGPARVRAEAQMVAALRGDATAAAAMGVSGLQAMVTQGNEDYGRPQSGAAISPGEWEQFRTILGNASSFSGVDHAINRLSQMIGRGEALMQSRGDNASGLPPGAAYRYFNAIRAASARQRRAERARSAAAPGGSPR